MEKKLLFLSIIVFFVLTGCQKEATKAPVENVSATDKISETNALSIGVLDTSKGWYGGYAGYYGPYPIIPASDLIKNGVAKDPYYGGVFSFTNCTYDIPSGYNISGDSLIFEAVVKNPNDGSYSEPDNDIVLQLGGDKNFAELHFVADQAFQRYTQYHIGYATHNNLPQLLHYFGDFQTVRLVLRNYSTAAFIDRKPVYSFNYGAENRIGKLLYINIAGKGYGTVNSVRLINSYTGKLILTEDFNTDGKSTTILY